MTTTQFLKISSADRTNGTPEDFTIDFPQHLRGKTFKLAYAFIPITWYNVNETNNKFYFEEVPSVTKIATIPTGIYNNTTILNAVKTAIESVSPLTYSVVLYPTYNKIEISAPNGQTWRVYNSSDKSTYPNHIHKLLGLDADNIGFFSQTIAGSDMVNLNPVDSVNIQIGDVLNVEGLNNQGTTLIIPIDNNTLSYINYSPPISFQQVITFPKHMRSLSVKVKDQSTNILGLNGIDYFLILERM